mmetsp:Transcript_20596/g.30694  ORF Transcript_20596/g.30694 Transcript_20596/m.30694 type:complete len:112 (-) Transcript_20596:329-664(-)
MRVRVHAFSSGTLNGALLPLPLQFLPPVLRLAEEIRMVALEHADRHTKYSHVLPLLLQVYTSSVDINRLRQACTFLPQMRHSAEYDDMFLCCTLMHFVKANGFFSIGVSLG